MIQLALPMGDDYADPLFELSVCEFPKPIPSPAYERFGFVLVDVPRRTLPMWRRRERMPNPYIPPPPPSER